MLSSLAGEEEKLIAMGIPTEQVLQWRDPVLNHHPLLHRHDLALLVPTPRPVQSRHPRLLRR